MVILAGHWDDVVYHGSCDEVAGAVPCGWAYGVATEGVLL